MSDPDLGENLLYFGMRVFVSCFQVDVFVLYFVLRVFVCCFQVNVFVLYFGMRVFVCCFQVDVFVLYFGGGSWPGDKSAVFWYACIC